ncbi:MAG TPA: nucleoside-diphosphate sugar epimerase/dehydratase [Gemmatimonadales bacterium]|nr:nucleoside-diphosphate sugar epimerase/dehydratase [Gemmatimonadales bacterium]
MIADSHNQRIVRFRNRYLFGSDILFFTTSTFLAFIARFEGLAWDPEQWRVAIVYGAFSLPVKLLVLWMVGLYRRLWRYAGTVDLERILVASAVSGAICFAAGALFLPGTGIIPSRVPLSVLLLDALLTAAAVSLPRLALRIFGRRRRPVGGSRRALIVGAGTTGEMIVKELVGHPQLGLYPVGFVDDDRAKQGHRMCGFPVLGPLDRIAELVARYEVEEIVIAMPRASGKVVREVVQAALDCGIKARTVPSFQDIISGKVPVGALRQVEIQDLLRREPIQTDLEQVRSLATGEAVLVTGAGGSIGSELCRQLARLEPARVLLLGHGENSIFDVFHELNTRFPRVEFVPLIADVRDRDRMRNLFEQHRPYAVFHAAAHKHVPLMEANIAEAVTNNVLGTRNVAMLSAEFGVEHLVLISTDKAVRPTSIMGATKRVAEQIVQEVAEGDNRNFVAVRFGNVLGSRGSVVPMFLRQIQAGGPVTITHPEMRRYFMTIPEAVQLVLQAGALGQGGEVFVLDMGEPVKILDLATDLIRLSGLEVGGDIEIRFTGTRPGEKLYEELFFNSENAIPTRHPKVLRAKNGELPVGLMDVVDNLIFAAVEGLPDDEIRARLSRLVPDFDTSAAAKQPRGGHSPTPVLRSPAA